MTSSRLEEPRPDGSQPLIYILAAFCIWGAYVLVHQSLLSPDFNFNNKLQILVWAIKSAIFGAFPASLLLALPALLSRRRKTDLAVKAGIILGLAGYFGVLIAVSLYFTYFGDLPYPGMLMDRWRETWTIRGQILSQLIGWREITLMLLWLTSTLAVAFSSGSRHRLSRMAALRIAAVLLAGNLCFVAYKWIHNDIRQDLRYGYTRVAQSRGIGTAYALMISSTVIKRHDASPPVPYPGKINHLVRKTGLIELPRATNIIILQIESLDWSVIDMRVGGRPITPFLDRLKTRSIFFTNFIAQHSGGGSSDSELSVLTSLLPSREGSGFQKARYDKIKSLPEALSDCGYTSAVLHPNIASYFHRDKAFAALGFDHYFHESYFKGSARGMFARDKPFLAQSFKIIEALPRPFFAYLITIQSHGPFQNVTDKKFRAHIASVKPGLDGITIDYLAVIHEVDGALEHFFGLLEKNGLIDKCLIVLFADHLSGVLDRRTSYERIPLMLYYHRWPARSVAAPGSHLDIAPTITELIGASETNNWLGSALLPPDPHRMVLLNKPMCIFLKDGHLATRYAPEDLPFVRYSNYLLGR